MIVLDDKITGVRRENLESGGFFFTFSSPLGEIVYELFGIVKFLNFLWKDFAQILTQVLEVFVIVAISQSVFFLRVDFVSLKSSNDIAELLCCW